MALLLVCLITRCCKLENRKKIKNCCIPCLSWVAKGELRERNGENFEVRAENDRFLMENEEERPRFNSPNRPLALSYVS